MSVSTESLYQEIILDHYRNPHHRGLREDFDAEVHHVNPTCGDEVTLRVKLGDGPDGTTVQDVSYDGAGCSISQASTSVMTDLVIGRPLDDALARHEAFLALMQSKGALDPDVLDSWEERLEDGIAFAGVSKFPARVKCALLGWSAFQDAVLRAQADQDRTTDEQGDAR